MFSADNGKGMLYNSKAQVPDHSCKCHANKPLIKAKVSNDGATEWRDATNWFFQIGSRPAE